MSSQHPAPHAVPLRLRILAVLHYLTLFPWLRRLRKNDQQDFLSHHYHQAAALFAMLMGLVFVFIAVILFLSVALVYRRTLYEGVPIEARMLDVLWKLSLCWLVFWVYAAGGALLGSTHPLPLVWRVAGWRRVITFTAVATAALHLVVMLLLPVAVHASVLARQDAAPGKVYMLYEDVDKYPQWLFELGFYRMSRAADRAFGEGSTVVIKLSEESIHRALEEARFVFIGSHGGPRGLLLGKRWFAPGDIQSDAVNAGLEYVYLTGCDSGTLAAEWQEALAPAEVVTFPRLTAIVEHIWWLWSEGPGVVQALGEAGETGVGTGATSPKSPFEGGLGSGT